MAGQQERAVFTVKQLCMKYSYLSQSLVYLWIEQGELPHYRLGGRSTRGRILIDEADYLAFVESRKVAARVPEPVTERRRFRHLS